MALSKLECLQFGLDLLKDKYYIVCEMACVLLATDDDTCDL